MPQLTDYVLSYCIIRSGGINGDENLFGVDFKGKRVIIIQAGTTGQVMYERLSAYCDVVGWYDTDYWEYRRCCMNVDPMDRIQEKEFDFAIIAKLDKENIDSISNELMQYGIQESKILSIDGLNMDRIGKLGEYLSK